MVDGQMEMVQVQKSWIIGGILIDIEVTQVKITPLMVGPQSQLNQRAG